MKRMVTMFIAIGVLVSSLAAPLAAANSCCCCQNTAAACCCGDTCGCCTH